MSKLQAKVVPLQEARIVERFKSFEAYLRALDWPAMTEGQVKALRGDWLAAERTLRAKEKP